ncbi:hypothetical protein CRE_09464 [Caenorhabditis remanei]|uniref:Glycosyltransferase family 92 protein n=1 Tax=Caenorhabditis remanei TaxID=31234 RepID=E3LJ21_CAERE|nr:hypothetical protein CRE_09464 [Caenorhabditis remanei]
MASLRQFRINIFRYRKCLLFPVVTILMLFMYYYKNSMGDRNITDVFHEKPKIVPKVSRNSIPKLLPGVLNDPTRILNRKLPVSHVYIVSAYYYPHSQALGKNAVVLNSIVDSVNFNIEKSTFNVVGSNETQEKSSSAILQSEGTDACRYASVVATTNTVDKLKKLQLESEGSTIEIPFKLARYSAPKPVIICIAPQYVAEQWQIFMIQAHVAHRFGALLHIYITSMVDSYFKFLKEYERQGYITIDFWLRMKFAESVTSYFEPNVNAEFKNQAGAYTDCLLQYKEAAKYIAFFEMEDILFPTIYPSYLREFHTRFSLDANTSSLYYLREKHEFVKSPHILEFSFYDVLGSLRSSTKFGYGAVVVKPYLHNSIGISGTRNEILENRQTIHNSHITHIQWPLEKNRNKEITELVEADFGPFTGKIRPADIIAIEKDITRIKGNPEIFSAAQELPSADYYFPIISQCKKNILFFESESNERKCPNTESCELSQNEDVKCVHSNAEYFSGHHMEPFTFHFSNNSFWSYEIGCYQ